VWHIGPSGYVIDSRGALRVKRDGSKEQKRGCGKKKKKKMGEGEKKKTIGRAEGKTAPSLPILSLRTL
jgi:hypothetical protein